MSERMSISDLAILRDELVGELADALEGLEVLFARDGETSLDTFERVADVFLSDTGYLRPGKDCRIHSTEKRREVWAEWVDGKLVDARVALMHARAALSAAKE